MKTRTSFTISSSNSPDRDFWAIARDYLSLTKPEITFLVTISALGGFLLGAESFIDSSTLLGLLLGVALSSSGGAAMNLFVEREKDSRMKRTSNRPLPSGRIRPSIALIMGLVCSVSGLAILAIYTNWLTCALAASTIVLYVFSLYTA